MKYENGKIFEQVNMFGKGEENTAFAKYFIGKSFLNPLTDPKCSLFLANVTFEPGCRNNWHIHHADEGGGQLLICTAGEGWYQEDGKAPVSLEPGSVIVIPPEVKHWHGAKKGQLVFTYCRRNAGQKLLERVVRACQRREIQCSLKKGVFHGKGNGRKRCFGRFRP